MIRRLTVAQRRPAHLRKIIGHVVGIATEVSFTDKMAKNWSVHFYRDEQFCLWYWLDYCFVDILQRIELSLHSHAQLHDITCLLKISSHNENVVVASLEPERSQERPERCNRLRRAIWKSGYELYPLRSITTYGSCLCYGSCLNYLDEINRVRLENKYI